jgi:hypothetical protein
MMLLARIHHSVSRLGVAFNLDQSEGQTGEADSNKILSVTPLLRRADKHRSFALHLLLVRPLPTSGEKPPENGLS